MEQRTIKFKVDDQQLEMLTPFQTFGANTVNYIRCEFDFVPGYWDGFTATYAVWYTGSNPRQEDVVASEIVAGETVIPAEMLKRPGVLQMNLCANYIVDGVLKARMTSYPVNVLKLVKTNV